MPDCPQCGEHLSNPSSFSRHMRTVHGKEKHSCSQCHRTFARRDNLQKHRGRCRNPRVLMQTPAATSLAETMLDIPADSPLDIEPEFETVTTVPPYDNTPVQAESEESGDTTEQSLGVPLLPARSTCDWIGPFLYPSTIVKFDFLGRFDCPGLEEPWTIAPTPTFLTDAVQNLRDNFPNANIEGKMHCCQVHRRTLVPLLGKQNLVDTVSYKSQHVPTIKCMDCPDELFSVVPFYGLGPVEDHLNSARHARLVRLRWIAESETARQALVRVYGAPVILTSLAKLKNEQLSVTGINELYSAKSSQTLLILAVKNDAIHVLRHLLDEKLAVNTKDKCRRSALHWACALGRCDMAELLLRYGARLDDPDRYLKTPLDLVMEVKGVVAAVNLIEVEAKVRLEESPQASDTPLALACRYGYISVIEAMIQNGANVDEGRFNSPLEVAVRKASWRVVQTLLDAGANVHSISTVDRLTLTGKGAYHGVIYPDSEDKISLLKRYGLRL